MLRARRDRLGKSGLPSPSRVPYFICCNVAFENVVLSVGRAWHSVTRGSLVCIGGGVTLPGRGVALAGVGVTFAS